MSDEVEDEEEFCSCGELLDDELEDDADMLREITFWQKEVDQVAKVPIVSATKKLVRAYGKESNMGNLFADAIEAFDPRIDIAVVNSGALRQDIQPGTVTKGDLISAFPFPNTVVMTKLKGSQVVKIFNHAAGMTNGILQVSKNDLYFSCQNKQNIIQLQFHKCICLLFIKFSRREKICEI